MSSSVLETKLGRVQWTFYYVQLASICLPCHANSAQMSFCKTQVLSRHHAKHSLDIADYFFKLIVDLYPNSVMHLFFAIYSETMNRVCHKDAVCNTGIQSTPTVCFDF